MEGVYSALIGLLGLLLGCYIGMNALFVILGRTIVLELRRIADCLEASRKNTETLRRTGRMP